jgi:glycosyltransferase involved in cell wall biosynthesis
MKFSVIIPCKNSGATIQRAVSSVLSQINALLTYEIILVPAFPAEDTTRACLDPTLNIRVVSQPSHIPLNVSRNYGIEAATGDIVCFLDADDYYCKGTFEAVFSAFNKDPSLNMVVGGINEEHNGTIHPISRHYDSDFYLTSHDQKDEYMGTIGPMWWQLGAYFFKASILKDSGIRFIDYGPYGEDSIFLATAICTFPAIFVSHLPFVVYVLNRQGDHVQNHSLELLSYGEPSSFKELEIYQKFQMRQSELRMKDTIIELLSSHCMADKKEQIAFANFYAKNPVYTSK